MRRHRDRWVLHTSDGEGRRPFARGRQRWGERAPNASACPARYRDTVVQLHSAAYRSPAQLPPGGSSWWAARSPAIRSPRSFSRPDAGWWWQPARSGGPPPGTAAGNTVEWLYDCGFFDQRPQDLADPAVITAAQPLLAPGGRGASLQRLVRSGAVVTGRLIAVDGNVLRFDGSAPANVAAADRYAAEVRGNARSTHPRLGPLGPGGTRRGRHSGTTRPADHSCTSGVTTSVPWSGPPATSVTSPGCPPTSSTPPASPCATGRRGSLPGLWYLGLRWLTRRSSGNFLGFPTDAATVAAAVHAHLSNRRCLS